jgi:uncharacterized protein (DUF2249 family)
VAAIEEARHMRESARELDVRQLPPPQRHSEIFRTFNALEPGEAFVLVNDHEPRPLLHQFQVEHPGDFEWSLLEAGPGRVRIEIRRRAGETSRNVTEYLEQDHRRLDAIVSEVVQLVDSGALAEAVTRFAEFACGLNRHIDAEENVLFPAFEKMTGMTTGPTVVMRAEHVEIRRWMDIGAAALDAGDVAAVTSAVNGLTEVLSKHNMKEEQILYPMTDRAAGGERERDELVRRMQAL